MQLKAGFVFQGHISEIHSVAIKAKPTFAFLLRSDDCLHWTMNVSCMSVIKKAFHGERHERVKGEAWPPTLRVYSRLTLRPTASTGRRHHSLKRFTSL